MLIERDTSRAVTVGGGGRADVPDGGAVCGALSGKDVLRAEGGNDTLPGGAGRGPRPDSRQFLA